jgi:hypothetical protein
MEQLVTVRYHALGAVEGTIETVSIHGGKRFVLYHSRTKKAVTCTFEDDEWLRQAADMLGRRVSVMGTGVLQCARGASACGGSQSAAVPSTGGAAHYTVLDSERSEFHRWTEHGGLYSGDTGCLARGDREPPRLQG